MVEVLEQKLEPVLTWLEAGEAADYRAGVLLLQEHCKNRGLVNNLLKKESVNNREKLVYELVKVTCQGRLDEVAETLNHFAQAVAGAVPAVEPVTTALLEAQLQGNAPQQPEHVSEEVYSQLDELTQRMSKLHNQRCQLSNSLSDLPDKEGPRVVAEILSLQNQYNDLFDQRRQLVGGEPAQPAAPEQPAPAPDAAPVIDRAELVKQRGNLRSNISKAKKAAESAKTEDKRSFYAQKAGQLEVELTQVELQLAQPQANV
jgi:hypothetical protein